MKKIYLLGILFVMSICSLQAQTINVYLNKTTSMLFTEKIKHIDLGTEQGIGFQLEDSIPNIVKLRINEYFPSVNETNMLVITESYKIFSFTVCFRKDYAQSVYPVPDSAAINLQSTLPPSTSGPHLFPEEDSLYKILINKNDYLTRVISKKKGKIIFTLTNIYTSDSTFYYTCEIQNNSNLIYKLDFINIYITDTKSLKTTAVQDTPLTFSFLGKSPQTIAPHTRFKFILKLPKYTMEDSKVTVIETYEKNGGRHNRIKLSNSTLLEATILKK